MPLSALLSRATSEDDFIRISPWTLRFVAVEPADASTTPTHSQAPAQLTPGTVYRTHAMKTTGGAAAASAAHAPPSLASSVARAASLEHAYLMQYFSTNLVAVQRALLFTIVAWGLLTLVDAVQWSDVVHPYFSAMVTLRVIGGVLGLVAVGAFQTRWFRRDRTPQPGMQITTTDARFKHDEWMHATWTEAFQLRLKDAVKYVEHVVFVVLAFLGIAQILFGLWQRNALDPSYALIVMLLPSTCSAFFRQRYLFTILFNTLLLLVFVVLASAGVGTTVTTPCAANAGSRTSECKSSFFIVETVIGFVFSLAVFAYFSYRKERLLRQDFLAGVRLEREEQKSRHLLAKMLPASVLEKMRLGDEFIYEHHPSISILFAHIAHFDGITSILHPIDLISLLNTLFSRFDELTDEHHVYKVETIGDVYLVASGCPKEYKRDDHAPILAVMALDMRALVSAEFQMAELLAADAALTVGLQIGLHSGSIIAGVVGVSYPRYRLMGDTINIASRMSTTCGKGDIQLSSAAFERLPPAKFTTSPRGEVLIKGKGHMFTHYLHAHCYGTAPTATMTRGASIGDSASPRRSIATGHITPRTTPRGQHLSPDYTPYSSPQPPPPATLPSSSTLAVPQSTTPVGSPTRPSRTLRMDVGLSPKRAQTSLFLPAGGAPLVSSSSTSLQELIRVKSRSILGHHGGGGGSSGHVHNISPTNISPSNAAAPNDGVSTLAATTGGSAGSSDAEEDAFVAKLSHSLRSDSPSAASRRRTMPMHLPSYSASPALAPLPGSVQAPPTVSLDERRPLVLRVPTPDSPAAGNVHLGGAAARPRMAGRLLGVSAPTTPTDSGTNSQLPSPAAATSASTVAVSTIVTSLASLAPSPASSPSVNAPAHLLYPSPSQRTRDLTAPATTATTPTSTLTVPPAPTHPPASTVVDLAPPASPLSPVRSARSRSSRASTDAFPPTVFLSDGNVLLADPEDDPPSPRALGVLRMPTLNGQRGSIVGTGGVGGGVGVGRRRANSVSTGRAPSKVAQFARDFAQAKAQLASADALSAEDDALTMVSAASVRNSDAQSFAGFFSLPVRQLLHPGPRGPHQASRTLAHRLTHSFLPDHPELEKEFLAFSRARSLALNRRAIGSVVMLVILLSIYDSLADLDASRGTTTGAWVCHGVAFACGITWLWLTAYRAAWYARHLDELTLLVLTIQGFAFITIRLLYEDLATVYGTGMCLFFLAVISMFSAMNLLYALAASILLVAYYIIASAAWTGSVPWLVLVLLSGCVFYVGSSYDGNYRLREIFLRKRNQAAETSLSKQLLANMLPAPILQLMRLSPFIALAHVESDILFSDIVGFTELASLAQPVDLVAILNVMFSSFDREAINHGVYKVETIGDGQTRTHTQHTHASLGASEGFAATDLLFLLSCLHPQPTSPAAASCLSRRVTPATWSSAVSGFSASHNDFVSRPHNDRFRSASASTPDLSSRASSERRCRGTYGRKEALDCRQMHEHVTKTDVVARPSLVLFLVQVSSVRHLRHRGRGVGAEVSGWSRRDFGVGSFEP